MLRKTARLTLITAACLIMLTANADAQWVRHGEPDGQIRFRLGLFEPAGGSDGWGSVFEGFTGRPADLEDFVWGADVLWRPGSFGGVLIGFSSFTGKTTSSYRDWLAADGSEIRHATRLVVSDVTAAWVYHFGSGGVRPYLGAGAGFVWWELTDQGEFIDFGDPDLPVFRAWYGARGTTVEALAMVGVDVPLNPAWSFFAEGRYRWASDELGDDFAGFGTLELGGYEVSGGLAISF